MICSSETNFQRDVDYLKCLFSANGYPERFVVKCIKTVINRKGIYGPERKPVFISLPYCGTNSFKLKNVTLGKACHNLQTTIQIECYIQTEI